jgi:hypothetical protein
MVVALAERYHRFPAEVMNQTPDEFYFNLIVSFPEDLKRKRRREERVKKEALLGYNPVRRLIESMKRELQR